MTAPQWVETVLAAHDGTWTIGIACECGVLFDHWGDHRAHVAAVLWAEFTARAQQTREDVAAGIDEVEGFSLGAWPWLPDADAAIAALLTAMGGAA